MIDQTGNITDLAQTEIEQKKDKDDQIELNEAERSQAL